MFERIRSPEWKLFTTTWHWQVGPWIQEDYPGFDGKHGEGAYSPPLKSSIQFPPPRAEQWLSSPFWHIFLPNTFCFFISFMENVFKDRRYWNNPQDNHCSSQKMTALHLPLCKRCRIPVGHPHCCHVLCCWIAHPLQKYWDTIQVVKSSLDPKAFPNLGQGSGAPTVFRSPLSRETQLLLGGCNHWSRGWGGCQEVGAQERDAFPCCPSDLNYFMMAEN